MEEYVYDIEIFPNFFSVTFLNNENGNKTVFAIFKERDDRTSLSEFLDREILLIGYNNLAYDGAILTFLTENINTKNINAELYKLSQQLISDESRFDGRLIKLKYPKEVKRKQMDLMKILAFDKLGVSLKQVAINLCWYKIQDLPLPYDHKVKQDEVDLILDYNLNDVLITKQLFNSILPQIELRKELGKLYNVDFTNASDSKMANLILENIYTKEAKIDIKELKDLRTERESVSLKECIGINIEFQTDTLKNLKQEIENTIVRKENNYRFKKSIRFGGKEYEVGVGGLHSVDDARLFKSTENIHVRDLDVASFYPHIIINNNLHPEHLGEKFVEILNKITEERIDAKKSKNKVKADGLKITINSIFGKLGSETFWLYDPKAFLTVTVSGQLYLLMLLEALNLAGIEIISANTDGLVGKIPLEKEEEYKKICDEWQEKTHFELEFTDYTLYARSDVNNYVTKKINNETKSKGRYVKEIDLKKGYSHPIVARCMYEYFVNNKSIEQTISESTNIFDFCMSQKTGGDFILEYHEGENVTKLQKNNRFYVSNSGGKLIKHHNIRNNNIGILVNNTVKIINDYDKNIPFSEYDLNFDYYKTEAQKYIDAVLLDDNQPYTFVEEPYSVSESESEEDSVSRKELMIGLEGIKGLSINVVNNLIKLNKGFTGNDFLELLVYAEENSLVSSKYSDLIRIGFFNKYGGNKKLLNIFEEFRNGKNKYTNKLTAKSKLQRLENLKNIWLNLPDDVLKIDEQIQSDIEILGKVHSKFPAISVRYCYVENWDSKYTTPKAKLYCLKKGTTQEFKISRYSIKVSIGDIIYCDKFEEKNKQIRKSDGLYQDINGKEWWLTSYRKINKEELSKLVLDNNI